MTMGSGGVINVSRKQKMVSKSSMEAELIARRRYCEYDYLGELFPGGSRLQEQRNQYFTKTTNRVCYCIRMGSQVVRSGQGI